MLQILFGFPVTATDIVTIVCLYHTIPCFHDTGEIGFWKHCGKRRKCWLPAFSPFPTMFSSMSKTFITFILSLANAFNSFPNKPWFLRVCSTSLLKTLREKEKLLIRSNFSFSLSVFYPFGQLSAIFIKFKIVVCKFFQIGRV